MAESSPLFLLPQPEGESHATPLAEHIQPGRLVELVSNPDTAYLTASTAILLEAQSRGESCAWIERQEGRLYPPDLAASGVDLGALVVVQVPERESAFALVKAAEQLLRSGAFDLLIIDLEKAVLRDGGSWQGRLQALSREHRTRIILLSDRPVAADSLGPLISLRLLARRQRVSPGVFRLTYEVLKSKAAPFVKIAGERRRGPWGLQ